MNKLAKIFVGEPISGQPRFKNLDPEHKVLIGEELASRLSPEELSDVIRMTRISHFGGRAGRNTARAIIGFGVAAAGLCFDYGVLDEVMRYGGTAYGTLKGIEAMYDVARGYVATNLYSNRGQRE